MPLPSPGLSKQIAGPQRNKQNTPNVLSAKIQPRSKVQIIYNNVGRYLPKYAPGEAII